MTNTKGAVLVVGGYGAVGQHLCRYLFEMGVSQLVIAGRNVDKASALCKELGGSASAKALDLSDPAGFGDSLDGISVAVACLEHANNPVFAKACFERGISYVEIPGLFELQEAIESYNDVATANDATGALSVGITPGISNLLVKDCAMHLEEADSSDLFVVFPLGNAPGEASGDNGLEWVISSLNRPFDVYEGGVPRTVEPFGECKQTELGDVGRRTGYRFDFSDQHSVRKVLDLKGSSFWMIFDTAAGERLAAAKGAGLFPLFPQSDEGIGVFAGLLTSELGGNHVIAQAEVTGTDRSGNPVRLVAWVGFDGMNSKTACVTAMIVKRILEGRVPAGVHHIESLLDDPAAFINDCKNYFDIEYHPPVAR